MFSIGIDIAKYKHSMAVIGEGGEKILESFEFANTTDGFRQMLNTLALKGVRSNNSEVCIESTGHYGQVLAAQLQIHGFEVREVNPILTHNFRKSMSVRKVKNDNVDASVLAQWLLNGNPTNAKLTKLDFKELKTLARSRTFLSHIIGDCKRKILAILDVGFPEYDAFFSDTFGRASLAVLKRWPSSDALAKARIDVISKCLSNASKNKLGRQSAESLKALAKNSFALGQATDAQAFHLSQLINQIEFTMAQMEALDAELNRYLNKANTYITTIPGIGTVCGAVILGELGDITRFSSASKIVAFAGYDPSIFESGEFKGTKGHISKRGSSYLRWMLYLAADRGRRFDPVLSEYYAKKRGEGKPHKVAMCAVVRKYCNIIFAVLRDNKPYVVATK